MRIHDLIHEIHGLKNNPPRKAAFDIYNILENNKALFAKAMDEDVYFRILKSFEGMATANASEYNSSSFKDEFQKAFNLLNFYLERVV